MPQPTASDVHVDVPLTQISVAYIQNARNFIAPQVFPIVPVVHQTDKYWSFDKNAWFQDEAKPRADASESAGSGYTVSSNNTYSCDVFALHKDVGDQARRNADPAMNLDRDAARYVASRLLLRMEVQWAADYFTTGKWGTDSTPGALWSNYATSDPIDDMEGGKETILGQTGFDANTLVLGYQVYRKLRHHPDIVDRFKGRDSRTAENINAAMLADIFDVERVLVCKGVKATNNEGATGAYSFVQGKHALLCYSAPAPALLEPSAGYVFNWTGVGSNVGEIIATSTMRIDTKKCDRIESEMAFDMKVIGSDLGYFFNGAVA